MFVYAFRLRLTFNSLLPCKHSQIAIRLILSVYWWCLNNFYNKRIQGVWIFKHHLLLLRTVEINDWLFLALRLNVSNTSPPSPSSHPCVGSNSKRKRSWSRAVFSNLQRKGLERRFQLQKYITKPDRRQLAATLGINISMYLLLLVLSVFITTTTTLLLLVLSSIKVFFVRLKSFLLEGRKSFSPFRVNIQLRLTFKPKIHCWS